MSDLISRQATVERLCKVAEFMNEKRDGLGSPYVMAALFIQDNKEEFPSVTPKQSEWIPVSERLPEENTKVYLVCFDDGYISSIMYDRGKWLIGGNNIIAWMPLPEPYKADMRGDT